MNLKDLLLSTGRFNRTKVRPHFINPCCFGEDFASWLAGELTRQGVKIIRPAYQEDWGWEMAVALKEVRYYVGIGAQANGPEEDDYGEWRIFVEKRRSFFERLNGQGKIQEDDPVLMLIERIVHQQPDFHNVVRDSLA